MRAAHRRRHPGSSGIDSEAHPENTNARQVISRHHTMNRFRVTRIAKPIHR